MSKCPIVFLLLLVVQTPVAQTTENKLWQPFHIAPRTGEQHMDLNGTWKLSYTNQPIASAVELPSQQKDPFETTVPNSIHWSLYKAGKLPHPYQNKNSNLYKWVEEKVWYYERSFNIPYSAKGNLAFISFDGIDYFSKLWVNDSLIGVHEGMFGGPDAEISKYLSYNQPNKVLVEIRAGNWGNKASDYEFLPRTASGERDYSKRTGFNPRASGRIIKPWVISGGSGAEMFFSVGMWQGARIEIVPKYHIERPFVTTKSITNSQAILHLSLEVLADTNSLQQRLHPWNNVQILHHDTRVPRIFPIEESLQVLVELVEKNGNIAASKTFPLKLNKGRNWLEQDITVPKPKLWNPVGLGVPNLYAVRLSLMRNNVSVDKISFEFGIRTITQLATAGPRTADRWQSWQFVVNGRKIFVKGMNWTPADVLLDLPEDRYRWALTAARDMGVQLIRVWGGGLLETNDFYKICNELGIMVWQDFPIGNQDTPEYPQDIWEAQVVRNIFRLRNHPSLAVWCGGNEFNPYSFGNAATIGILERSLQTFDNTRMFVRTTPDAGSMHTYPDMDPAWYKPNFRYEPWISETGMHSMPEANLFYELVDRKEYFDLGKMWDTAFGRTHPDFIHHFAEYGPGRVPRMLSRASHIINISDPSLENITEATQIGAGEFYQVMSEKVQGNYPVTAGLMPWVFKRHWPVTAIQMMDWFGQPVAPYYFLKRTYEPTHVSIDIPRLLWKSGEKIDLGAKVTHSLPYGIAGAAIHVSVFDDEFNKLSGLQKPVSIAAGTSVTSISTGSYTVPDDYTDRFLFLVAELKDASGKLVSRSIYYPRVLTRMREKAFYDTYTLESNPWPESKDGPWLKPTVAKTSTTLTAKVVSNKTVEKENEITVVVQNKGNIPSFMTTLDVTGVKRAFTATDNFFWLAAGETKEVRMKVLWREGKQTAGVRIESWNAKPIHLKLANE